MAMVNSAAAVIEQTSLLSSTVSSDGNVIHECALNQATFIVDHQWRRNKTVLGSGSGGTCFSEAVNTVITDNHIILDTTEFHAKPAIFVIPDKTVYFSNRTIMFSIQTYDVPQNVFVIPAMFEAIAESPSGQQLRCQIQKKPPGNPSLAFEVFTGSFKATGETGLYTIRVRLSLPFKAVDRNLFSKDFGVAGDIVDVLISRNYLMESWKISNKVLQLSLEKFEELCYGKTVIKTSKAWGIACDKQTNLIYFTERVGNQVKCMDSQGNIGFRFNQKKPESQLNRPTGICCDEFNRRVIICDKDNHRICFFTMDGQFISSFGERGRGMGMLCYPWGVDVSSNGERIVVADSRNSRLQLFDGLGNSLHVLSCVFKLNPFECKPRPVFKYPRGVSFDADGELIYVSDFKARNVFQVAVNNASYRKLLPDGKLSRPAGLIVDPIGNFLVIDSRNNSILHCNGEGDVLCTIQCVGDIKLEYPVNLTLMRDGVVAVLDGRGRILIF